MTRVTRPGCAIMYNLIDIYIHTHAIDSGQHIPVQDGMRQSCPAYRGV